MNTYIYSNGSITASSGNISIDSTQAYGIPHITNDELLPITFGATDENGRGVTLTLKPEGNISTGDLTKILMLTITMVAGNGRTVNALSYVKKHNLERHFTYS